MEPANLPVFPVAIQVTLVLAGVALLWRLQLSPQADRRPRLEAWEASLLDIGMLLWVVLLGGFALQVGAVAVLKQYEVAQIPSTILASASFQGGMLLACLGFAKFSSAGRDYTLPKPGFLLGGLGAFLAALPLVYGTGLLWHWVLKRCGVDINQQDLVGMFRDIQSPFLLAALIGLAVIAAPVTEELVFRAGLFRYMRTRTPRWVALLVPALLFGALHMNLASFPQLVLLGVIFGIAFERSGNIAVSMFAHALFNLNTILMILSGVDS